MDFYVGFDYRSCYLDLNKYYFDVLVVDYAWKQVMFEVVHDHASLGGGDGFWLF